MKSLAILNECGLSEAQINFLKDKFSDVVFYTDTSSEKQAIKRIATRNIVIMDQFMFTFTERLLQACSNLELIVVNTTAYDTIDTDLLKKYNIKLANLSEYATQDVAETAIAMMLSLNNRTQIAQNLVKKNQVTDLYPGNKFTPSVLRHSLKTQTIGIIGLGKIGQSCAKMCSALGLRVFGYNRTEKRIEGVFMSPLKTLCKEADIIIIALSHKKGETDGIINQELLSYMKKGVILVSIAHPDLINIDYLIKASSKFGGIGFDYLVTNKVKKLMQVYKDNLIITPHLGSQSVEAVSKMTGSLIEIVVNYSKTG